MTNNAYIALICDDNYFLPTVVTIQSIADSIIQDSEFNYHIYVCTFGLEPQKVSMLEKMSGRHISVHVEFFDINDFKSKIDSIEQKSHVTPSALIKFSLADHFNKLDRLLYLDSDIIIKNSLEQLFKINLDNYLLAAAFEFYHYLDIRRYSFKKFYIEKDFYFNSGVMLLNLTVMRDEEISKQLWEYKLYYSKTSLMDQESFNAVCANRVYRLPIKWNCNPAFIDSIYIQAINFIYGTNYKIADDIENDATIIHYVGKSDKPWKYSGGLLRKYWVIAYRDAFKCNDMTLPPNDGIPYSIFDSLKIKYKTFGIKGITCFILNKIFRRREYFYEKIDSLK